MSARPASSAARIASDPNPLVTATIVIGCGARRASSALTWARRSGRASKPIAGEYKGLATKQTLHALGLNAVDDVAERLAGTQVIAAPQIVQRLPLIATQHGGIPELQEWDRKRRRDLLGGGLEVQRVGVEQFAE